MSDAVWFDDRPRLSTRCPRCGGHGAVDATYALVATSLPVPDAEPGAIQADVVGAFDIFTACREAAEIAGRASKPVTFYFNGQLVVVRPGADPDAAARAWWIAEYNETPEETAARR